MNLQLLCVLYARPSNPPSFDNPNDTWRSVTNIIFPILLSTNIRPLSYVQIFFSSPFPQAPSVCVITILHSLEVRFINDDHLMCWLISSER
jgi:hypothetical protein